MGPENFDVREISLSFAVGEAVYFSVVAAARDASNGKMEVSFMLIELQ